MRSCLVFNPVSTFQLVGQLPRTPESTIAATASTRRYTYHTHRQTHIYRFDSTLALLSLLLSPLLSPINSTNPSLRKHETEKQNHRKQEPRTRSTDWPYRSQFVRIPTLHYRQPLRSRLTRDKKKERERERESAREGNYLNPNLAIPGPVMAGFPSLFPFLLS